VLNGSGIRTLVSLLMCAWALLTPSGTHLAQNSTYTTTFALTENPISEGGKWINGGAAGGNLWGNVQTTPGLAFGVSEPTQFGDPTAVLTGSWTADQAAQATAMIRKAPTGACCHEAEVRLRTTISSRRITGYEVYCSVMPARPYCHIASWGGPNGAWVNLTDVSSTYLRSGDVLRGTVTGTNPAVITMYINGVKVSEVQDTGSFTFSDGRKYGPWTTGSPGIGFYNTRDSNWSSFGFSSFTAQNLGTGVASAPTNVRDY
jgi:hypothetical protein